MIRFVVILVAIAVGFLAAGCAGQTGIPAVTLTVTPAPAPIVEAVRNQPGRSVPRFSLDPGMAPEVEEPGS